MASREFNAIIYGASGFTGQFVVEEFLRYTSTSNDDFNWAIAGRDKNKLLNVLTDAENNTNINTSHVSIIEANSDRYESVVEMCKKTQLVISVVGPYRFFGEPVVKACIEASTDYVDISGEPQFLESMQLKYHEEAKKKGLHLVGAAGWDSIPTDCGITWTKKMFRGDLIGCETIISWQCVGKPQMNYGTWWSAIHGLANSKDLAPIRSKLFKEILPSPKSKSKYQLPKRGFIHRNENGYCATFMGSDRSVVKRSEIYKYHHKKERPVSCEMYFEIGSLMNVVKLLTFASIFNMLTHFKMGRYLLETFPGFFSMGIVKRGEIERATLMKNSFVNTIIGYGWNEKYSDIDRQHDDPPTKRIVTKVSGPDAGYVATAIIVVQAALTLLKDKEKLSGCGVLSPGAAFRDTNLVDRLIKRGIKFEIVEEFE